MKKFIKNLLLGLIIISALGVQPVFATDYDLNTSVYNHLENWDTEFEINYYSSDALDVVKDIAKKDDYLTRSLRRLEYNRVGHRATVKVTYLTTKEQEEYINKELTQIVNSIITNSMSDFEKIKTINKYIVDRYEYDDSLVSNNVYSALTTGKTICQGYAMTAYKMLNLAGIENKIIVGDLDGVPHGWNLVKLNGNWYQLDVTNNDVANDRYFLKNDDLLRHDGFTWEANDYPICDENYDPTSNRSTTILNNNTQNVTQNKQESNNYGQTLSGYKSNVDGNWYCSNGSWYFLKNIGIYSTGWNIIDNKWYCLESNGKMKTGWIYYNRKWYYCYPVSGDMATNTIIDGYRVDLTGAWIA
ncbi:MAG: cell wall-binding protein [Clostridium sp.]|uniref:transglutaminase domain-containing protein n=1 Tax=Clostridium sp. TaxID=1506 RepID=UPI0025B87F67|nr:transglutaminase domain-containing protein [Clostridium sp.]MCE5220680.1 cell wall-binding protein [Clostridium sp.]